MKIFTILFSIFLLVSISGQVVISNTQDFQPVCAETSNSIVCRFDVDFMFASIPTTYIASFPQGNPYSYTATGNDVGFGTRFVIGIQNLPGNVTASCVIRFTDVSNSASFKDTTIAVTSVAGISLTTNTASVCSNGEPLNLNDFQISPNGRWNISGAENFIEEYDPRGNFNTSETLIYTKALGLSQCIDRDTLLVTIVPAPQGATFTSTPATSCANPTGSLNIDFGGTGYNWWLSTGEFGTNALPALNLTNLIAGPYTLRISNPTAPFCRTQLVTNILANDFAFETTFPTSISCFGAQDGQISATIVNATPGISFLWSNGATSPTISNLGPGEYRLKATNTAGCSIYNSWIITEPAQIKPILNITRPSCAAQNGVISITAVDGAAIATSTVTWTGTVGSPMGSDYLNVGAGEYSVVIADINGCTGSKTVFVSELNSIPVISDIDRPDCNLTNGNINVTPLTSAASLVSSTLWSNGLSGEDMLNVPTGSYRCFLTSSNGCKSAFEWNLRAKRPAKQDICVVTVDTADNFNIVVWQKPVGVTDIFLYNIYREVGTSGNFQLIDTVHFTSLSEYKDSVAEAGERSWRYKISAVNVCGIEGPKSDRYKTMQRSILTPSGNPTARRVVWDAYEGANSVSSYLVFRKSLNTPWSLIQTVTPSPNTMSILDIPTELIELDYFVEINFVSACLSTQKANSYRYSRSNKQKGIINPGAGINEIAFNDGTSVVLYPNPVENELIIETDKAELKNVTIVGIDGKEIQSFNVEQGKSKIDVSRLSAGSYFIHFVEENTPHQLIFIKK
jgi:hypothetical protein